VISSYVFDISAGQAIKSGVNALVINVVKNTTVKSPFLAQQRAFAFSLEFGTDTVQAGTLLDLTVEWGGGADETLQMDTRTIDTADLRRTIYRCKPAEVLLEPGTYPGGSATSAYVEHPEEGTESCMIVVQPREIPDTFLIKFQIMVFDIDEEHDTFALYDGDTPYAVETARFWRQIQPAPDPKYFASSLIFFQNPADCPRAVGFRLTTSRKATEEVPLWQAFAKPRGGIALNYELVDPEKMDHIKATIRFVGAGDLTDKWVTFKLRKILAEAQSRMYTSILFESVQTSRRSTERQLLSTSDVATRTLATSNQDALDAASSLTEALNQGTVTVAMNNQGIPGSAELVGAVSVFRCGIELECVPTPPEIITTPAPPPPPTTPKPEPFPLLEVVGLSAALIALPIVFGLLCMCAMGVYKVRDMKEARAKKGQAIEAYEHWLNEKETELKGLDEFDQEAFCKKFDIEYENLEADFAQNVKENARMVFAKTHGLGDQPSGLWRHLPAEMVWTEPLAAVPSASHEKSVNGGSKTNSEEDGKSTSSKTSKKSKKSVSKSAEQAENGLDEQDEANDLERTVSSSSKKSNASKKGKHNGKSSKGKSGKKENGTSADPSDEAAGPKDEEGPATAKEEGQNGQEAAGAGRAESLRKKFSFASVSAVLGTSRNSAKGKEFSDAELHVAV